MSDLISSDAAIEASEVRCENCDKRGKTLICPFVLTMYDGKKTTYVDTTKDDSFCTVFYPKRGKDGKS